MVTRYCLRSHQASESPFDRVNVMDSDQRSISKHKGEGESDDHAEINGDN